MSGILGYARVSTGDRTSPVLTMRLERAGAIRVFTERAPARDALWRATSRR